MEVGIIEKMMAQLSFHKLKTMKKQQAQHRHIPNHVGVSFINKKSPVKKLFEPKAIVSIIPYFISYSKFWFC